MDTLSTDDAQPAYLNTPTVARRLGVVPGTVHDLIRDGKLPAIRVGRVFRIREDHLQTYIQAAAVPVRDVS